MPKHEITAVFSRERFAFQNGDPDDPDYSRVVIAEATLVGTGNGESGADGSSDGKSVVLKGEAACNALKTGLTYRFYGREITHPKYGDQFAFTSFVLESPAGKRAVTVHLQQCDGIGWKYANGMWEKYGDDAVKILREDPERVAREISGLSLRRAEAASELLKSNLATERAKMDLLALLHGQGLPRKLIDNLIRDWGSAAAERVRHNPYMLMRYRGCGFIKTDRLYMQLGKPPGALKRQALCLWHAVAKAGRSSGDTWFAVNQATAALSTEIAGADLRAERALLLATRAGIVSLRDDMGSTWIAEERKASNEERLAEYVAEIMAGPREWPDVTPLTGVLDSHQFLRLQEAMKSPLGILTGSPGSGKTYIVAALIRRLMDLGHTTDQICVCAPTGKAAVRVTEAMQWQNVPIIARTIHSTLDVQSNEGGWSFIHGRDCPLPFKWVFMDECFPAGTMIDTPDGQRAIETILPGDRIHNAYGIDAVVAVSRKVVRRAVKITYGKASFVCSPDHPIFTDRGFISAQCVESGDSIVSTAAAMRLLRNSNCSKEIEPGASEVLLRALQREMVDGISRVQGEGVHQGASEEGWRRKKQISEKRKSGSSETSRENQAALPDDRPIMQSQAQRYTQENRSQAADSGREWKGIDGSTETAAGCAGGAVGTRIHDQHERISESTESLQNRHSESAGEDCSGVRRYVAQFADETGSRRQEGCVPDLSRVDSAEILEQGHPELDKFRDASGELYFYDIQAARHRSYSVNGVLVHNCSMMDTDLGASFFAAIGPGTHVLLIGDVHQLPPVGHGAPLRDMIAAGVPTGMLSEVRRNSGRIVQCCHEIRTSKRYVTSSALDLPNENLLHVEQTDADGQLAVLSSLISQIKAGEKYDATWDVQVCCAVNKKSPVSRKELNKRLQALLNPNDVPDAGTFQVADKIINTKNSWFKSLLPLEDGANKDGKVYVANGEQGEVLEVQPNKLLVRLWTPDRTVIVPRGKGDDEEPESDGGEQGGDQDDAAEESGAEKGTGTGCSWELGYAISVHKSQGSEWPIVVLMLDDHNSARRVQNRNWLYTGISRAKVFCVTIGLRRLITDIIHRDGMNRRTALQDRIKAAMKEFVPGGPCSGCGGDHWWPDCPHARPGPVLDLSGVDLGQLDLSGIFDQQFEDVPF